MLREAQDLCWRKIERAIFFLEARGLMREGVFKFTVIAIGSVSSTEIRRESGRDCDETAFWPKFAAAQRARFASWPTQSSAMSGRRAPKRRDFDSTIGGAVPEGPTPPEPPEPKKAAKKAAKAPAPPPAEDVPPPRKPKMLT